MPYFTFTDASDETFVIRLDDPDEVAHARALLAGTETDEARIGGVIVKSPAEYNIGWSYQLDPDSIFFFDMSTEVGDSTMRYVENHLPEVGGHLLPGRVWTGWSSTLTGELNLVEGGPGANRLTGGGGDDLVLGRGGNDVIFGLGGHDHLSGGDGNDLVFGGEGGDKIGGGAGADILYGGLGGDVMVGDGGSDLLYGDAGNDKLYGNDGVDTLLGGSGNDRLWGGANTDVLEGGAGADRLNGGAGNDILVGGSGTDRFYFNTPLSSTGNVDAIGDFASADDSIFLNRATFSGILGNGALNASAFHVGTAAADASDRIIYDPETGSIFYDADGKGGAAQVLFAVVAEDTVLTSADFIAFI
ncbi:MAG: hypothetical protein M3177_02500 [Pseudomonadota bacterium]|nr:hypothetical protein [Pseudomonadota bacterium]